MKLFSLLLYVRDLDASLHFYGNTLGLHVVRRPAPHLAVLELGEAHLYLHSDPGDAPDWMRDRLNEGFRGVGVIPHIEVEDIRAAQERIESNGYEISLGPLEQHGHLQLYIYDPSGYNLVLIERNS